MSSSKRLRALFFSFENDMKINSLGWFKPHKTAYSIRKTGSGVQWMTHEASQVTISGAECMFTLHVLLELIISLFIFHAASFGPVIETVHGATESFASVFPISQHCSTSSLGDTCHQGKHRIKNSFYRGRGLENFIDHFWLMNRIFARFIWLFRVVTEQEGFGFFLPLIFLKTFFFFFFQPIEDRTLCYTPAPRIG